MPLIPRKRRVIGKILEEKLRNSLIELPFEEEQMFKMEVIAVGELAVDVQVGDIAILPEYGGAFITLYDDETNEEEKYFVIDEEHILAVYREDASE